MTRIIEKRLSLHKQLAEQRQHSDALKSQIGRLQGLANLGTAACMIAHEINNLLTPLAGYATLALNNPNDKALIEKALEKTARNCERASKIAESMFTLANGRAQEKKNARLAVLVEEVFTCLCRDFAKDGITVEIRIPKDLTIRAMPFQIQQVLMNLILNARDAMLPAPASPDARRGCGPRGGILTIEARDTIDAVQIEVIDTGRGIEPGDLENIFEPFFTTKAGKNSSSANYGSGLGLAFCKKIIDAHEGCISVESRPARGSTFKITLPKAQSGSS